MKKIIILLSLCLYSTTLWAQQDPLASFFNKYKADTSFTIINISPRMFQMFAQMNSGSNKQKKQVMDIAKKLTGLRIITKDNVVNSTKLFREANNLLSGKKFEKLMTVRDHNEQVKFLIKPGTDGKIHHLIMLIGGDKEFFAMSLTGDIDLNDISKLAGTMNIQGFNKLKDLQKAGKNP
jgi:hypothetical protein